MGEWLTLKNGKISWSKNQKDAFLRSTNWAFHKCCCVIGHKSFMIRTDDQWLDYMQVDMWNRADKLHKRLLMMLAVIEK